MATLGIEIRGGGKMIYAQILHESEKGVVHGSSRCVHYPVVYACIRLLFVFAWILSVCAQVHANIM